MTSDMFKAYKVFDEIFSRSHRKRKLDLYLNDIQNYLSSAFDRATKDLPKAVKKIGIKNPELMKEGFLPPIHDVMIDDLRSASANLVSMQEKVKSGGDKELKNGKKVKVSKNTADAKKKKLQLSGSEM